MPRATGGWKSSWRCTAGSFSSGQVWGPSRPQDFSVSLNVGPDGDIRTGYVQRSQRWAKQRSLWKRTGPMPGHQAGWKSYWRCSARSFPTLPSPWAWLDQFITADPVVTGNTVLTGIPALTRNPDLTANPVFQINWNPVNWIPSFPTGSSFSLD